MIETFLTSTEHNRRQDTKNETFERFMFGIRFPRFTQFNKLNDLLAATASGLLLPSLLPQSLRMNNSLHRSNSTRSYSTVEQSSVCIFAQRFVSSKWILINFNLFSWKLTSSLDEISLADAFTNLGVSNLDYHLLLFSFSSLAVLNSQSIRR